MYGIAASDGCAAGPVFCLKREPVNLLKQSTRTPEEEKARLQRAIDAAKQDLAGDYEDACRRAGAEQAEIFQIHSMLLEDEEFSNDIQRHIEEGCTAEYAVEEAGQTLAREFAALDDEYMKARAADFEDIAGRVVRHLSGRSQPKPPDHPIILVADDLTPGETLNFSAGNLLAIVARKGSWMSHSAILARNLGVPAVVAAETLPVLENGREIVVDGTTGTVLPDPTPAQLADYSQRAAEQAADRKRRMAYRDKPAVTRDGVRVEVACNIGSPEDVAAVLEQGGESVGLFRSEFLFLGRDQMPDEEEQARAYGDVLEAMGGRRVIVRTLDIGADKQVSYLGVGHEENPALGCRAIRLSLARRDVFRTQLRALLRASVRGKLAIMFPLIISPDEITQARQELELAREELRRQGVPFDENIPVGAMVETPAAAVLSAQLAEMVEFFSIGTNDLTQYTLAVDRDNPAVATLYNVEHPAVLQLIRQTVENAHAKGIWVGICGESASDPALLRFYLSIGVDELSVSPMRVLQLKETVTQMTLRDETPA